MIPVVDSFGRRFNYLRLSVTGRCNFHCQYCSLPKDRRDAMSLQEILRIARVAASLGVVKVRLTGGEPTVRADLLEIVRGISRIPGIQRLVMTTNGAKLAGMARALRAAGLQGANVSLDSLHAARFRSIARGGEIEPVLEGIRAAKAAQFHPLKVNMVVMGGVNDDEVVSFAELAAELGLEVRFIEYMPMNAGEDRSWTVPYQVLLERVGARFSLQPLEPGQDAGPAELYRLAGTSGVVGFIHAMSNPFCARCNRLRVTAEGKIRSCLLTGGEVDLLRLIREGADDEALAEQFREAAFLKPEVYELHRHGSIAMRSIGG